MCERGVASKVKLYFGFTGSLSACREEGLQTSPSGEPKWWFQVVCPFSIFYLLLKNVKIKSFGLFSVKTTVYFSLFSFV